MIKKLLPKEIEEKSFSIIEKRVPQDIFSPEEREIVKKIVHTTADFSLIQRVCFSKGVIKKALKLLKEGRNIFTDVQMVSAGISPQYLNDYKGKVICEIRNPFVAEMAEKNGITRAEAAVKYAVENYKNIGVFAIGNAPTALFEIIELAEKNVIKDFVVIGACVGMVGAAEAKKRLTDSQIPCIAIRGKRGGSPIAATILNGLFKMMRDNRI